jgi:glycosyltransferase involved in cell wall biosynthesis
MNELPGRGTRHDDGSCSHQCFRNAKYVVPAGPCILSDPMQEKPSRRIVCLSNVWDQQYVDLRGEAVAPSLSHPKRRNLFDCLETATGLEVIVLSSPPKALERRKGRWLHAVETRFSHHRQFFCANWDAPKFRIPSSWIFYAFHVRRHVRDGDIILLDNYEWLYVIAAYLARLSHQLKVILDYEDGKHLIDKGVSLLLTRLAEATGRPLLTAALVAAPPLQKRLPSTIPVEFVPGFYCPPNDHDRPKFGKRDLRFLYSGSLDKTRGVDLILSAFALLPASGWQLDITGAGEFQEQVREHASGPGNRITFHSTLSPGPYDRVLRECDVGLNCQRASDPISEVTFPSKIFTYLSAGLVVLSSSASGVPAVCGDACVYYDAETPTSLAQAMQRLMENFATIQKRAIKTSTILEEYSFPGTSKRLRNLFEKAGLI